MPIYKWFNNGGMQASLSENSHKTAIKSGLTNLCSTGYQGKVLPVLKASLTKPERDYYLEFTRETIKEMRCHELSTFSNDEMLGITTAYSKLSAYIANNDINSYQTGQIQELTKAIQRIDFKILIISESDTGTYSPFVLKSYQLYSINSDERHVVSVARGSFYYNEQLSFTDLLTIGLKIFILTLIAQPVFRLIGIISIPETCRNTISYLLCPIAFLLGSFLPYMIFNLSYFLGFSLPGPEDDFLKSLHWIFIIFALVRYMPSVLLSTLCYRLNIYEDYVKEKWFMCLTITGGALGNLVWIFMGTCVQSSTLLDHTEVSPYTLLKMIFSFGHSKDKDIIPVDSETGERLFQNDVFEQEFNPYASYDTHELALLGIMFVMLAMVSAFYQSDVLCGRASVTATIASGVMIIGCNLTYAALLLSLSSYKLNISYYLSAFSVLFVIAVIARATKYGRTGRKIDSNLEAPEEHVIVDQEAKNYLINKNEKAMVTKLGKLIFSLNSFNSLKYSK